MDLALDLVNEYLPMDDMYGSVADMLRDSIPTVDEHLAKGALFRQAFSIYWITAIGGLLLYFGASTFSYIFCFNKRVMDHPKWKKNQIWLEIKLAVPSIFGMSALTLPLFMMELHSPYCGLYRDIPSTTDDWLYIAWSLLVFLVVTDTGVYWVHRFFHVPGVYGLIHKPHHRWVVCSPYASIAFSPLDGWGQSLPMHVVPYLINFNSGLWLILFVLVQCWSVIIHDGWHWSASGIINTTAHHTLHHSKFTPNLGQYLTFWDRAMGTYVEPKRTAGVVDDKYFEVDMAKVAKME